MRYVIEFLVPALVVIVLATLVLRNRGPAPQPPSSQPSNEGESESAPRLLSTSAFVTILIVAAAFTVALVYELEGLRH
jgi:hypothetical protein